MIVTPERIRSASEEFGNRWDAVIRGLVAEVERKLFELLDARDDQIARAPQWSLTVRVAADALPKAAGIPEGQLLPEGITCIITGRDLPADGEDR